MTPPNLADLAGALRQPLVRAAIRNWWIAIPAAYVIWHRYQRAAKANNGDVITNLVDAALPVASLAGILVTLNEVSARHETTLASQAAPAAPIKDAQFVPLPAKT